MAPPLLSFMAISTGYCGVLYMVKLCEVCTLAEWFPNNRFVFFFNISQNIVSCSGFLGWVPDNCGTLQSCYSLIFQALWHFNLPIVNRMYIYIHIAAPCYQPLLAVMLLVHYQKSLLIAFGSFQITALFCRSRSSLGAELELGWKLSQLLYFWVIPGSTLTSRSCIDSSMQFNKILMTTKEWFVHIYSLLRILGQKIIRA